ncbi:hypothetical protein F0L68_28075 [Solihabitans fulvus]|uniref:Calcium-dependent phosphoinositide phospholipase C n=1 Tax=Solihabitans fulvus TaxID=1892852 RepID=A0A5B2WVV8_9PSEU|nr:phosphatidylinositol-specific phospholipase C1-like protein [Solihabitans fulvus]KAA2255655.1 hypothetical protein F0L68_28075 [Solihabitans fulvus]
MRRSRLAVITASLAVTIGLATAPASVANPWGDPVRLNQIQAIATHNSYHRELTDEEKAVQKLTDSGAWNLAYSHASLPKQFGGQRVRGIELDIFPDPDGGLYAAPLVRRDAGLGPITDPEMRRPGIKVMHWADHDYGTSCASLVVCLRQVREWSNANRGHAPIPILLEFKQTDPAMEKLGGPKSPPWDAANLDRLDAELRSVFAPHEMITPDDIRRPGRTLEQSVLQSGWPTVAASAGKVLFLMDNQDGPMQQAYRAGRPSLEGRVVFTNSRPGRADAAFIEQNDPTGANTSAIQDLVRRGYFVRTRSDEPFTQARSGDTSRLDAALASGAQMISTDFPVVGLAARYGTDYVAQLPGDDAVRCNPVNARRSCRSDRLDRVGS